jgi:hypothetical protein
LAAGAGVALLLSLPALPTALLAMLAFVAVALVTRAVPPELRELVPRR